MEGLRAIAAVGVMIAHTKLHTSDFIEWGITSPLMYILLNGLTLFFGLSGFLLYRPFATGLMTGSKFPNIAKYARNRALRIYPVYIVIVLAVSLVMGTAYAVPQQDSVESSIDLVGYMTNPGLILVNLTMLQTFFPFSIKTGLGVAWSLTVELIYYIVMPLLAFLALRLMMKRRAKGSLFWALLPVIIMFAIGMIGKIAKVIVFADFPEEDIFYYEWGGNWFAVFARSFPVQADLFAWGMLAAVLISAFEHERIPHRLGRRFRLGAVGVAAITTPLSVIAPSPFNESLLAIAFGAAIFFVALPGGNGKPGLVARTLEWLPIRYVGLVSYSFYLWHLPVVWLVVKMGWTGPPNVWGFLWNLLVVFVITLALSSVTYHLVEKQALKLKKRTGPPAAQDATPEVAAEPAPEKAASA